MPISMNCRHTISCPKLPCASDHTRILDGLLAADQVAFHCRQGYSRGAAWRERVVRGGLAEHMTKIVGNVVVV
jgi:hypothetical protein